MAVARTNKTATSGPAYHVSHHRAGTDPQIASTRFEPTAPVSDLTLVFLHGAAHDETCWQYRWTDVLARQGWRCLTLSYRAHGRSIWSQPVQHATLDDYLADVEAVLAAERLDSCQVVLIGHSLGGGLAQRFAARHEVTGLVIAASLAFGLWMPMARRHLPLQLLHHPFVYPKVFRDPSALFQTPRLAREYLFGRDTPEALVQRYLHECWCHESGKALLGMMQAQPHPLLARHICLLAGRKDTSVPLPYIQMSAGKLHASLIAVDAPHDLMLAGDWQSGVEAVASFARTCQEIAA